MLDSEAAGVEVGRDAEGRQFGMRVTAIQAELFERRTLPHDGNDQQRQRREERRQSRFERAPSHCYERGGQNHPDGGVATRNRAMDRERRRAKLRR